MANVSDTFKTGTMLKAGGPLSTIDVDEAVQQAQAEGALQGAQVNLLGGAQYPGMAEAAQSAVTTAQENVGILEAARRAAQRHIGQAAARGTAFALPAGTAFGGGRAYAAQQGALEGAAQQAMFGMQAAGQLGEARSAAAEALLGQAGLADRPAAEAQNFLNSMAAYSQIAKDDQSRQHYALSSALTAATPQAKAAALSAYKMYGGDVASAVAQYPDQLGSAAA